MVLWIDGLVVAERSVNGVDEPDCNVPARLKSYRVEQKHKAKRKRKRGVSEMKAWSKRGQNDGSVSGYECENIAVVRNKKA